MNNQLSPTDQCGCETPSQERGLRQDLVRRRMRLLEQLQRIDRAIAYLDINGKDAEDFIQNVSE